MGIFRFFVCLLLLLLSSASFAVGLDNDGVLSLGYDHSCVRDDTGVVCWGRNDYGQTNVPSLSNPRQVSAGGNHTCAIDDTGVVCWGRNDDGQSNVPTLFNPRQVSAGFSHTCALDDTGLVCWGHNGYGETAVPTLINPSQASMILGWCVGGEITQLKPMCLIWLTQDKCHRVICITVHQMKLVSFVGG